MEYEDIEIEQEDCNSVRCLYNIIKPLSDKEVYNIICKNLKNKLKYGTIYNSCYKDELLLINENKGAYLSSGNAIIVCDIVRKEIENHNYSSIFDNERYKYTTVYGVSNLTPYGYVEFVEFLLNVGIMIEKEKNIIKKEIDEKEEELIENGNYIYMSVNKDKFQIESQFHGKEINLYFQLPTKEKESNVIWSSDLGRAEFSLYEKGNGLVEIKSDDFYEFVDKYKNIISSEVDNFIGHNVKKINNGYLFNNSYYETFEDVSEAIKDGIN